jgi:putative endonuclease
MSQQVGVIGEKLAEKYLKQKGYRILARNFCNSVGRRMGEIDIIAQKNNAIIFVEVKTRLQKTSIIIPEECINRAKLHKLNKIASYYLKINNLIRTPYSFDAISIIYDETNKKASIRHLENIYL